MELRPGGSAYVDLTHNGDVSGRLTIDVEALTTSPAYVRGTVLAFGDHPHLCTDPVAIDFTNPADPFADTATVSLPAGCQFATLVLTHTDPTALEEAQISWQAGWSGAGNTQVVIAGQGYEAGGIDELAALLREAGYEVTTSDTVPASLGGIDQLWWYDYRPFPQADVDRLVQYVNGGGGLYLTGERPCCEDLNGRVSAVLNDLLAGDPVQTGGLGDPYYSLGPVPTNPDAIDGLTTDPFTVTEVVVDAPGGMSGIDGPNVLATAPGNSTPVAAAWNETDLTSGSGRLAVVMDVNWLDPSRKGAQADEFVQNLALFLSGNAEPPAAPVDSMQQLNTTESNIDPSTEPHPTTSGATR